MTTSKAKEWRQVRKTTRRGDWKIGVLIIATLVLGIVFAVVHDAFYASLAGKTVQSTEQQQWFGQVGTGLAFLVKTLFASTAGAACVQLLWWTLRRKPTTVQTVDSSFGLADSPLALFSRRSFIQFGVLRETPLIVLFAAIAW
jgi:hypothetical protein